MTRGDREKTRWAYYATIVLFVGVLAFAILGLVRSTGSAGASTGRHPNDPQSRSATPPPTRVPLANGRIPTPQIPPPTPSAPTEPPSRTYLHPAPELAGTAPPAPAAQPR